MFEPSVAVHWTTVVPNEKLLPEAGEQFTGTEPETMSDAVAEKLTIVDPVPGVVMSDGKFKAGAVVSRTVT